MTHSRWTLRLLACAALATGLLFAGCGPQEEDPCADTTCDFGVCTETDDGEAQCSNRTSCNVQNDCVPGYECGDNGQCQPVDRFECEQNSDCPTDVCQNGVCANPESCQNNSECLPKTYCDKSGGSADAGMSGGTCEPDPCNGTSCPRGKCKRGTDRCVSRNSCTKETEILDCISGQKCLVQEGNDSGQCLGRNEFCNQLSCGDNGVCSFQEGGCANADSCEDDTSCVSGFFCNSMGQCRPNLCEQNDIDCGDDGVCQPTSGKCENASSCSSNSDCRSNPQHLCVDGTCRLAAEACGDADGDGGCPGRQTCEYDSDNNTANCEEPETCVTSLDCTSDRRCGGETCLSPEMCSEDRFEMNDSASNATTFTDNATNGTLRASLCSGNSDFFEVDTRNIVDASTRGTLVVEVNVRNRERGLGQVNLELLDANGQSIGTANTGSLGADGQARVTTGIMVPDHGTYTIEVSPGSDMKQPGVNYALSADILPQNVMNACNSADEISVNQRISGTTQNTTSSTLGSSCTKARNPSNEKIYTISVQRPQELTISLTAQLSGSDYSMSLRQRCTQNATEIACSNDNGTGGDEEITEIVSPGTYYLIVQSPDGASGGPFGLFLERVFTTCSSGGNYCDTSGNSHACTIEGGRYETIQCVNGCNPTNGNCFPPAGDMCGTANTINPSNAQSRTVHLNQGNADYQVGAGSCLGSSADTQTEGQDIAYEVEVPSRQYVKFEARFADNVEGSLYLVDDCTQVDSTCELGVQSSTSDADREVLEYSNTSMNNDETFYLIVDTDGGQRVSTATLDVTYQSLQCTPGTSQCTGGGTVGVCSEYGLQVQSLGTCASSCSMGTCGEIQLDGSNSDSCSSARDITGPASRTGGTTITGSWGDFSNNHGGDDTCGGIDDVDTDGNELVWKLQLDANEGVRATISGDGQFSLFLKPDGTCGTTGTTCLAQEEQEGPPATIEYQTQNPETVYLVAEREATSGGTFALDVNVASTCSPTGSGIMCSGTDLQYCSSTGLPGTFACGAGCSNASCDSDTCSDAVDVTSAAQPYGGVTYSGEWSVFNNDLNTANPCSSSDGLSSSDVAGAEHLYEFTLQNNERVQATLSGEPDASIYLKSVSGCGTAGSGCKGSTVEDEDPATITYTNTTGSAENLVFVADRESGSGGAFDVTIDIKTSCSPVNSGIQCTSSGDLQYCNAEGYPATSAYSCNGGCSSASCGSPSGGICVDAKPMTDGDSDGNLFDGVNSNDPVGSGNTGNCSFGSFTTSYGADWAYAVTLADGETVTATDTGGGPGSDSCCDLMYILKTCGDGSTCQDLSESDGSVSYTNTTGSQETVYVIMDHEYYTDDTSYGYNVSISVQ